MATDQNQNLNQKLAKFCANMAELEKMSSKFALYFESLMDQPDNKDNVMNKLDANITCSFVNASFYWLYLVLKGADLQDHPIKDEIARVRKYMQEYMVLKKDAPKLNVKAAQNFIRNALWDPTQTAPDSNKRKEDGKPDAKDYKVNNYYNKRKRN